MNDNTMSLSWNETIEAKEMQLLNIKTNKNFLFAPKFQKGRLLDLRKQEDREISLLRESGCKKMVAAKKGDSKENTKSKL